MPDAELVAIADAVTATLNAASLSQSFTAIRVYVPITALEDLDTLSVKVVPLSSDTVLLARMGLSQNDYVINIGVQKSIGSGVMTEAEINAATDPLLKVVEEITDLFPARGLATFSEAVCISFKATDFLPKMLDEKRVFMSVVSLTFRLVR